MKILVIGCVFFSSEMLKELINMNVNVVGVCTTKSSSFNNDHFNLGIISEKNNIPTSYLEDINSSESINWIKEKNPDIIFCLGWSRLIKKDLLEYKNGIIGYHPAALPMNRGRHPLIWALALGLKRTGSTFFFMDENADSGDIISQEIVDIKKDDDANSLYQKIINISKIQLKDILINFKKNKIIRSPQNDNLSNYWRKRNIKDGEIDWRMSSESIDNLIKALTHPYIGAHFLYHNKVIKVWKSKYVKQNLDNIEPGKVLSASMNHCAIKTGDGIIQILDWNPGIEFKEGDYL